MANKVNASGGAKNTATTEPQKVNTTQQEEVKVVETPKTEEKVSAKGVLKYRKISTGTHYHNDIAYNKGDILEISKEEFEKLFEPYKSCWEVEK